MQLSSCIPADGAGRKAKLPNVQGTMAVCPRVSARRWGRALWCVLGQVSWKVKVTQTTSTMPWDLLFFCFLYCKNHSRNGIRKTAPKSKMLKCLKYFQDDIGKLSRFWFVHMEAILKVTWRWKIWVVHFSFATKNKVYPGAWVIREQIVHTSIGYINSFWENHQTPFVYRLVSLYNSYKQVCLIR